VGAGERGLPCLRPARTLPLWWIREAVSAGPLWADTQEAQGDVCLRAATPPGFERVMPVVEQGEVLRKGVGAGRMGGGRRLTAVTSPEPWVNTRPWKRPDPPRRRRRAWSRLETRTKERGLPARRRDHHPHVPQ
jgi:hypothetical protein